LENRKSGGADSLPKPLLFPAGFLPQRKQSTTKPQLKCRGNALFRFTKEEMQALINHVQQVQAKQSQRTRKSSCGASPTPHEVFYCSFSLFSVKKKDRECLFNENLSNASQAERNHLYPDPNSAQHFSKDIRNEGSAVLARAMRGFTVFFTLIKMPPSATSAQVFIAFDISAFGSPRQEWERTYCRK
jgi:hypothetical protein